MDIERLQEALKDFEKRGKKEVCPILDQFLCHVAKTGETMANLSEFTVVAQPGWLGLSLGVWLTKLPSSRVCSLESFRGAITRAQAESREKLEQKGIPLAPQCQNGGCQQAPDGHQRLPLEHPLGKSPNLLKPKGGKGEEALFELHDALPCHEQQDELVATLQSTFLDFIHCIIPNGFKQSGTAILRQSHTVPLHEPGLAEQQILIQE